jgi:hypothetical protein
MAAQTVEQFLFEQLEKVAPGKYTLASVLERFKSKLRFPCHHRKGSAAGSGRVTGQIAFGVPVAKDYNLSTFKFPNGVVEIKCLYNCGLKIRSDEKELAEAFNELRELPTTNSPASSEERWFSKGGKRLPIDPGPTPTYSDEYRRRVRESGDILLSSLQKAVDEKRITSGAPVLGGVFPHPGPVEAPDSIIKRGITKAYEGIKSRQPVLKGVVVAFDTIPSSKPKKIKARRKRK